METLPCLITPRLRLRQLRLNDVPGLFEIFSDPRVTRFTSHPPLVELQEADELLTQSDCGRLQETYLKWGIARRETDELIGTVSLFHWDKAHFRAELGYALAPRHWNQGLGTEAIAALVACAFDTLAIHRLEADVDPRNTASLRLLEKLGFAREGVRLQRFRVGDEWQDSVMLGLLRDAFQRTATSPDTKT